MKRIYMQVGDYLNYCKSVRMMSEATMVQKENVLYRFLGVCGIAGLEELTNEVFNKWVEHETKRGISARSVNAYNAVVLAMVRYYREMGLSIPLNVVLVPRLREGSLRRGFYSSEEVMRVVSMADFEMGLLIRVMFETGMRIAEATRLRVSDFDRRCVRFVGKGNKPREAYVTPETFRLIQAFVSRYEISGYLWSVQNGYKTLDGRPPSVNTIRKKLKSVFREAGFVDFYPHALRHSFATDLQLKGASVEEIKEMIGHSSIATTERYLHGFDGRLEELFDKYR